jgi:hypothetical protein
MIPQRQGHGCAADTSHIGDILKTHWFFGIHLTGSAFGSLPQRVCARNINPFSSAEPKANKIDPRRRAT